MKKTIKLFLAIAVAIVALVSCAKENLSGDRIVEVTLIAGNPEAPAATRTEMSGTTPYWSVGDKIGVSTGTSGNYEFSTGIAAAATSASFTGSTVSGDLYAYYPYDDDAIRTANAVTGKRLNLIKDQNPTATSFDGDADIMVAKKFTVSPENTTVEDLEFARLGAIVKIVLIDKESKMTGTQYPTSVSMTAESALAGYVMLDLVNQEMTAPYYNTSTTVTANYTNETRYAINGTNGAYLIVAPQTLAAGTSLTIAAATADYTISKTITVPAGGIELLPGKVNTLNIGLYSSHITANAYPYELYSGDISEGDYLIVYDGVAMKATIDSDRLQYTSVSISDNKVFNPGDDIIWHIAQSGEYWTIYNADSDKYAASTGAKSKAQLLDDGSDDKSKWTVTGSSTYEFVNKANAAASVNANLRRNGTYGFACYGTGTGGALSLYKLNDGKTAAGIAYARTSDTIDYGESLTPPTLSNAHGLTLASCVSSNESVATVSAAGVISVVGNPGTTTITVSWAEQTISTTTYRAGSTTYTLTINPIQVATPYFTPGEGTVAENTEVTIHCDTDGATIYYTVDNSDPTAESAEYSSAITIDAAKTIKAIAVKANYVNSAIATATYTIDLNTSTEQNPYTASEAITLSSNHSSETFENVYVKGIVCQTGSINGSGQVNYYVSDDGTTTSKFEMYKGKYISGADFTAETNMRLGDFVVAKGTLKYFSSGSQAELDENNVVISVLRAPSFSVAGGLYNTTQSVTLTADDGATIYYTLDGSTPTSSSSVYSTPLSISETTTVKAIAIKNGVSTGVATVDYVFGGLSFETVVITDSWSADLKNSTGNNAKFVDDGQSIWTLDATYGHKVSSSTATSFYSPKFDMSGVAAGTITFAHTGNVTGASYQNLGEVYYTLDDGDNWTKITLTNPNNNWAWQTATVASAVFAGETIQFRWDYKGNSSTWEVKDFVITVPTITFSQPSGAAGEAGCSFTVTRTVGGTGVTTGDKVANGTSITLTATEGTDFEFTSWIVTGATVADASASTTTFTMADSPVTISANFSSTGGGSATPTLQYTLDGTVTATGNAYATASTLSQSDIGWKVVGNTEQNPWRIGGKSITNTDRAIYSTTAISANITQINVTSGATASSLTVNSLTISVHSSASDAENGTNAVASKTVTSGIASSTVTFDKEDDTSWAGKYYRIVYNVTRSSSSGNGYITFNSATFYGTN